MPMSNYPTPGSSSSESVSASPKTIGEDEQPCQIVRIGNAAERRRAQNRKSQAAFREKRKKGAEKIELLIREDKEAEERILNRPEFPLCPEYEQRLVNDGGFYYDEETYANVPWELEPNFPLACIIGRQFMPKPSFSPERIMSAQCWLEATRPQYNEVEFYKRHMLIIKNAIDLHMPLVGITPSMLIDKSSISPFVRADGILDRQLRERINTLREHTPYLAPVDLQISVPHHPYIDLIPFPAFRTTILEIIRDTPSAINQVEFCQGIERCGLRLWGTHSYDPSSYELTEVFAEKWGYLFSRDSTAIDATNTWRMARGSSLLGCHDFTGPSGAESSEKSPDFDELYLVKVIRMEVLSMEL